MKKPTIEEIKNDFAEWHGTEWETPYGQLKLIGVDTEGWVCFESPKYADNTIRIKLHACTPIEPLFEGWVNIYESGITVPHSSKEEADKFAADSRIKCIKIREVRE